MIRSTDEELNEVVDILLPLPFESRDKILDIVIERHKLIRGRFTKQTILNALERRENDSV